MERNNGLGSKAKVYTDLAQLAQLKRDAKSNGPPETGWRSAGRAGGDMSGYSERRALPEGKGARV
jgi:hypothetical protein